MPTVPTVSPQGLVTPAFDLSNVRTLRAVAFLIDLVAIAFLAWLLGLVMVVFAIPTYGASFLLAPLVQLTGLFYSGLTLSGRGMGTWGMRAVGLKATDMQGQRLGFIVGAGHATLFWLSAGWLTWLLIIVSFFNADKRALHDIVTNVIISRRV